MCEHKFGRQEIGQAFGNCVDVSTDITELAGREYVRRYTLETDGYADDDSGAQITTRIELDDAMVDALLVYVRRVRKHDSVCMHLPA